MMPTTTLGRVQIHARNLAVTQTVWMFEMTPTKATAHIYSGVRSHSAPRDSRTRESPQKDEPGGSSIAEGNADLEEGQYVSNVGKENYPGLVGAAVCREKEWSGQSRITAATDTCAGGEAALY